MWRTLRRPPDHVAHSQATAGPEEITNSDKYIVDICSCCGKVLVEIPAPPPAIPQMDSASESIELTEHHAYHGHCPDCKKDYTIPLPESIKEGGLMGSDLTAFITYMKGAKFATFSTVRKFPRDLLKIHVIRSVLVRHIVYESASMEGPDNQLVDNLCQAVLLYVDETGHHQKSNDILTWCIRAHLYSEYNIDVIGESVVRGFGVWYVFPR